MQQQKITHTRDQELYELCEQENEYEHTSRLKSTPDNPDIDSITTMSSRATPAKATAKKNACVVNTVHQQEAFLNLVNTTRPSSKMDRTQGAEWKKIGDAMNKDEMFVYHMTETNVKPQSPSMNAY